MHYLQSLFVRRLWNIINQLLYYSFLEMAIARYSHCFSKCQLQIIIESYLNLKPYFTVLLKVLKLYTQRYEQLPDMHRTDKPHPVRIYAKDYQCTKNLLEEDWETPAQPRIDPRSTYASNSLRYYYIYPLECVIEMLESEQFYKMLPQNIIINGLFTQTNVKIIIETLKIVSEDMSKKIRSAIAGKEIKPNPIICDKVIEVEEKTQVIKSNQNILEIDYLESKVHIPLDQDEDLIFLKPSLQIKNQPKIVKKEIIGTNKYLSIDQEVGTDCGFCEGYLIYLMETVGDNPSDEDTNRISMESARCLRLIAKTVTHFTMYLTQNNLTHIKNDIHVINRVLNTMGVVITEDIYSSQLNPKNKVTEPNLQRKPKNLIQDLQPYFKSLANKGDDKFYSIEQLFRMVIYSPTTEEVKQQLKLYQADHFQKDAALKSYQKQQRVKQLLRKQCQNMKQIQNQRLKIAQNTVNVRPIFKQLQFGQQPLPEQSTKPSNYNVYNASRANTCKQSVNQRCQSAGGSRSGVTCSTKIQNKTLMMELSNSISKVYLQQQKQTNKKIQKKGRQNTPKTKQQNKQKTIIQQQSLTDINSQSNALTMSKNIKQNLLKNQLNQRLMTTSTEGLQHSTERPPPQILQQLQQPSDHQFRKILYNAFTRSNGLSKGEHSMNNQMNASNTNNNSILTMSMGKCMTKKNNAYSSSLSEFIGRKQEQQQIQCIQKRQKQLYNKQLLNGHFTKLQIQQELSNDMAIVYEDFNAISPHYRTNHFQNRLFRNQTKQTQQTMNLFKTQKMSSRNKPSNTNVIFQNSTKYNQSGLIRNQKYNKSIKSQLINHRKTFLMANEKENQSKFRLAQTNLKKKHSSKQQQTDDIRQRYQKQLKTAMMIKRRQQQWSQLVGPKSSFYCRQT